uniref:Uncharacterized protein n=1 Tax=Oryza nivara TaxID=4536 RepID=A0A0E0FGC4_ORYNI
MELSEAEVQKVEPFQVGQRLRKVRFPMTSGSVPVRLLDGRLSATTRVGLRRLHVTPSQLHKLLLLFHEASASERCSLILALKASSAASSLLLPPAFAAPTARMKDNNTSLMGIWDLLEDGDVVVLALGC